MKKRVAYLEIDGKQFGKDDAEKGLNVTFDVPYTGTGFVPNNATFTITNLNKHDMEYIVTNTARFEQRRRKIKFFAGYEGSIRQIFGGQIFQATPIDMPDTVVSISTISDIQDMGDQINVKYQNPTFMNLIDDARKLCGYKLDISDSVRKSNVLQRSAGAEWDFTGSAVQYLREVEIALGVHVKQASDALAFVVVNNTLYIGWQNEKYQSTAPVISAATGMIGIPSPTETGINIQVLMDVGLSPFQTIYLQSEKLPLYNGEYNIINIRHHGSLRGRDWYSDLECVKVKA